MSTPTIRRVSHAEILCAVNATELIAEYAAECSIESIGRINPQLETYAALERSGMMSFFGVFAPQGLVGFASELNLVSPHYNRKLATVESLFVSRQHRGGAIGRQLMNTLDDHASAEQSEAIFYSAPTGSKLAQVLALSHTYLRTNEVYCRHLL